MSERAWYTVTLLAIAVAILRSCWALRNIYKSIAYTTSTGEAPPTAAMPNVVVVICALREGALLRRSVEYFSNLRYPAQKFRILLITTERERDGIKPPGIEDTPAIAQGLAKEWEHVLHLHYPDSRGIKSDQMNFGVASFGKLFPEWCPKGTFYAFFDADSRPDQNVFRAFARQTIAMPWCRVFQLSAVYFGNFLSFKKLSFFSRFMLQALAARQTRFCFAYEIPRIQAVFSYAINRNRNPLAAVTYAPCVGHGLFAQISVLNEVPFPSRYFPEAMFWGFLMAARKEPVALIPSLDWAETPYKISHVFFQMARWFQGPASVRRYVKCVRETMPATYKRNRLRIELISGFALYDSLVWVCTAPVIAFFAVMSFKFGSVVFILFSFFIFLYQFGTVLLACHFMRPGTMSFRERLLLGIFGPLALATYSLASFYAIFNLVQGRRLWAKTERTPLCQ